MKPLRGIFEARTSNDDICPKVQDTLIKGVASILFNLHQSAASAVIMVGQTKFVGETSNSLLVRLTTLV